MIQVFMVDDYMWYAAESAEDAVKCAMDESACDRSDFDEDINPISEEGMNRLVFVEDDENETKKTFRQKLDEMIAEGYKFPCMFASTEC